MNVYVLRDHCLKESNKWIRLKNRIFINYILIKRGNMMPKERAVNMITKIKERIDKCEPMIAVLSNQTSEFIEDSYNDRKIDIDTFNELRHRLKTAVNQFPLNCVCAKK